VLLTVYFSILAVESDLVYERRGRIQRKAGIHPKWFRHPDAIRIPESVFSGFSGAFKAASPDFNYYGPTEYKSQQLERLCTELRNRVQNPHSDRDPNIDSDHLVRRILATADQAFAANRSLPVFGL
jgi:hypothetical protein